MDVDEGLNDGKPTGDELCRLCANTDKQFIPIFQGEGIEHNISEQIKKYLPIITVTKMDKLPVQICYQCTSTLLAWHNFFEQCRTADDRLRKILSVNCESIQDDESCHDYTDDFRDDFNDQPSDSDQVCDNTREKAVLFDLTISDTEIVKASDNNTVDISRDESKSVSENLDGNRFARKMTVERGSKDDVCLAPKTAAARESGEHRGRSARCQHCPMVFLSADLLASHMSSSHNEHRPTLVSTRESANVTKNAAAKLEGDRKRRTVEKNATAPKSKVAKVEHDAAEPQESAVLQAKAEDCVAVRLRVATFQCTECPKSYKSASSLKRHNAAVHQKSKVFRGADEEAGDQHKQPAEDSTVKTEIVDVDPSTDGMAGTTGDVDETSSPNRCSSTSTTAVVETSTPKRETTASCEKQQPTKEPPAARKRAPRRSNGRSAAEHAAEEPQPTIAIDTIVCSVCGETFDDESTFAEHQTLKHDGAAAAGCDICELQLPTATLLRAHKIANHLSRQRGRPTSKEDPFGRWYVLVNGQKHLKCDQCSYNSLWHHKGRFLEHYRIHTGERPFTCDLCGKQFRTRSLMLKHIAFVHEGVKEHACDLCGRRFSDKRYMEDHRRIHTGERPYVCDLCGKTFKQGASLFIHKELHKGLRKHACDMCGKRFTTSSSLHVHIRRHVGERNFVCAVCGKAFVDGKHLRDHSTVHSDERPFGCELCGARFKLMKHLKQHGRTHKRDLPTSVARAGRKRISPTAKRRLSPSVKEERAKIVKSKKIRLLDCATASITPAAKPKTALKEKVAVTSLILIPATKIATPSTPTTAEAKLESPKSRGRRAKVQLQSASPPRTRFRTILPKPSELTKAAATSPGSKDKASKSPAPSAVLKIKDMQLKLAEKLEETAPKSSDKCATCAKPIESAVAAKSVAPTEKDIAPTTTVDSAAKENTLVIDCDDCQFTCNSMLVMLRHCRSAHPDEPVDEKYTCFHCNYSCKRKYDIKRHILNVHMPRLDSDPEVLTCGICWLSYSSKSTLRRHVVSKHFPQQAQPQDGPRFARAQGNRGYCCDICGCGYEKQREMLAHRDVYHATAHPMRWSAFQTSKGKLKECAECQGLYRAGRFFDDHKCISKEDTVALEQRMYELLRSKPNYRCDVCPLSFMWKPVLRQHREVTHPEAAALNWDEVETSAIAYYCADCSQAFDDEASLERHECAETEPPEVKPQAHVCLVCGGSYQRKSDYRRHQRLRHGIDDDKAPGEGADAERRKPLIQCPYCETCAMTRTHMVAHIKKAHEIETESPFLCLVCNKVFKRKATLDTHNQVYHPQGENALENERVLLENQILLNGETAYHCAICNRNMFNAIRFLAHHRLHFVERKFTCDLCGKQTRTQHQLNTHIKIIHLNIRNYECDICAKSFHSRQSCEEHRRIHTGERPFSCEICGKTFIAMNALFTHKKFHDDFFAHACHLCPKKFKVRRSLTNHIRTHTGERPFKCDICAKTFNNSSRFSYHKKVTHSDNRPHKCTLCGSQFKANKFLLRHMKLHKTRTHIQFRRRNNPEYFAAQDAAAAAAASRSADPQKGLHEIVNEEVAPDAQLQPQVEYKIIEAGSPLEAVGSILYCDSVSAATVVSDGKNYAEMVDVSLRFTSDEQQLQTVEENFEEDAAVVVEETTYPSSSAS